RAAADQRWKARPRRRPWVGNRARSRGRLATRGRVRRLDEGRQLLRPDLRQGVLHGRAAVRVILDSHHHLWDTRELEYALFGAVDELRQPFLAADYELLGLPRSICVEAASAGADGGARRSGCSTRSTKAPSSPGSLHGR